MAEYPVVKDKAYYSYIFFGIQNVLQNLYRQSHGRFSETQADALALELVLDEVLTPDMGRLVRDIVRIAGYIINGLSVTDDQRKLVEEYGEKVLDILKITPTVKTKNSTEYQEKSKSPANSASVAA